MRTHQGHDGYSPIITEDLLSGHNEWRNVQDIVRLTLKSLTDIVRTQGAAIKDLEQSLANRISKHELSNYLAGKADQYYVQEQLSEIRNIAENRSQWYEIQCQIDDRVTRNEVQYLINNKPGMEEIRQLVDGKLTMREFESFRREIFEQFSGIELTISNRSSHVDRNIENFQYLVQQKAGQDELEAVQRSLDDKIGNLASKMIFKSDFDSIAGRKADMSDIQRLIAAIESKAELAWVEQLSYIVEDKCDKNDLKELQQMVLNKAEKREVDLINAKLSDNFKELDYKSSDQINALGKYLDKYSQEFSHFKDLMVEGKVDTKDFEKLAQQLNSKADQSRVAQNFEQLRHETQEAIQKLQGEVKQSNYYFSSKVDSLSETGNKANNEIYTNIQRLSEQQKVQADDAKQKLDSVQSFANQLVNQVRREYQTDLGSLSDELEKSIRLIDELHNAKPDKNDVNSQFNRLNQKVEAKSDNADLERAYRLLEDQINNKVHEVRDILSSHLQRQEQELMAIIQTKADHYDVSQQLADKVDAGYLKRQLGYKANGEDLQYLRSEFGAVKDELTSKATVQSLNSFVSQNSSLLEDMRHQIMQKSSADELRSEVSRLYQELDQRALTDELANHISEEAVVIEALCSENTVARWIWKSGELKTGNIVPWEIQSINTCPDNFVWERDATGIVIVAPGLYELSFGFFSKKKPTVQVIINGEPLLSAVNNAAYIIHHQTRLKSMQGTGNITGLTLFDFVAIPPRARLSLCYTGEGAGEGFFGLRKL